MVPAGGRKMMDEFGDAAMRLSFEQQQEAMRSLLEVVSGPEACIIRQKLAEPNKLLTPAQQFVLDTKILPAMVERCVNYPTCNGFTLPGVGDCDSCAIRFS
jgi:hypothetical protein